MAISSAALRIHVARRIPAGAERGNPRLPACSCVSHPPVSELLVLAGHVSGAANPDVNPPDGRVSMGVHHDLLDVDHDHRWCTIRSPNCLIEDIVPDQSTIQRTAFCLQAMHRDHSWMSCVGSGCDGPLVAITDTTIDDLRCQGDAANPRASRGHTARIPTTVDPMLGARRRSSLEGSVTSRVTRVSLVIRAF
jgi:hypothetical protein